MNAKQDPPITPDKTFDEAAAQLKDDEAAKLRAATAASDGQKSLDRLFDYTKFHIGLYLTLTASYVAVASIKKDADLLFRVDPYWFWPSVACFMVAGLAGGIIASSLTQTSTRSTAAFLEEELGPWATKVFTARVWTWIEHTAFWAGLLLALVSVKR